MPQKWPRATYLGRGTHILAARREALLHLVLKQTSEGFFIIDSSGRLLEVNPAYCAMSGYTRADLLQRGIVDVEAFEAGEAMARRIASMMGQGSVHVESRHRRKDGSLFDVELEVNVLDPARGWLIAFCRDITARKQAEAALCESEARYRTLVEQMTQGVLVYQDEQVVFGNAAAAAIIGCSVDDLQYASLADLAGFLHADDLYRFMIPPEERPGTGAVTAEPFRFTRS